MVKAARTDSLVERVDQLADVYGEVLLGLYDELSDQRERTEAVAARADGVLTEARRLMDDLNSVATEARSIEQQATAVAAAVPAPVAVPDAESEARTREALTRLEALEAAAAALERSVQERTAAAVTRAEALTSGLGTDLRAHVQESVGEVRAEVQHTVTELRQHVRELVDAVTREAHEAARRAGANATPSAPPVAAPPDPAMIAEEVRRQASAVIPDQVRQHAATSVAAELEQQLLRQPPSSEPAPDAAMLAEEVRRRASASIADQVRRQAADSVAEELQRQRQNTPLAPAASPVAVDDTTTEQIVARLQGEIEARTSNFSAAAQRAQELSARLDELVNDAQTQLQDAKTDRAAAAFALRESRAELDAAKRALDLSDYTFTLDRLRRTEMFLYATAAIAVIAIGLALWALLK
jgi:hypothetical protein